MGNTVGSLLSRWCPGAEWIAGCASSHFVRLSPLQPSATPIRLVRPHVLYEYADPDLEALSSGQKMLLRMGAGNAEQVKQTLRQLRAQIATAP